MSGVPGQRPSDEDPRWSFTPLEHNVLPRVAPEPMRLPRVWLWLTVLGATGSLVILAFVFGARSEAAVPQPVQQVQASSDGSFTFQFRGRYGLDHFADFQAKSRTDIWITSRMRPCVEGESYSLDVYRTRFLRIPAHVVHKVLPCNGGRYVSTVIEDPRAGHYWLAMHKSRSFSGGTRTWNGTVYTDGVRLR